MRRLLLLLACLGARAGSACFVEGRNLIVMPYWGMGYDSRELAQVAQALASSLLARFDEVIE